MKNLWFVYIALFFLFSGISPAGAASSEPAPLLPESLAARNEMAANQKTLTVLVREKDLEKAADPEKAIPLLNNSNDAYAKKGWSVFSILPYYNDGEFQGFFVTYHKSLIIE
ncbi:MAG: hypothetical protein KJ630_11485 [Proteobacteria bacterium]|nr:hypothetical protein [Pseudomonadota bacterium]